MIQRLLLLSILTSITVICSAQTAQSDSPNESWSASMTNLSSAVIDLIPFVYSKKNFNDGQNRSNIDKSIAALENAIEKIPSENKQAIIGRDPLATSSLAQLSADISSARSNFEQGHLERARTHLHSAIDHCFRCHSRSPLGPEHADISTKSINAGLSLAEQADLFVATRQYLKAINTLEKKITQPRKPLEQHRTLVYALKKYLAIAVRIKKNPNLSIKIIEQFKAHHHVPLYLKGDLAQWEASLRQWQSNKKPQVDLEKALNLIAKGNQLEAEHGFQRGYIEYLRGSAILHELLSLPDSSNAVDAQIYLALGKSYETIIPLGLWDLPEIYYTACINTLPKSKLARQCYTHLEHNILLGYTGSAGTHVPGEKIEQLKTLCELAGIGTECFTRE